METCLVVLQKEQANISYDKEHKDECHPETEKKILSCLLVIIEHMWN